MIRNLLAAFVLLFLFCSGTGERIEKGNANLDLGDFLRAQALFSAVVDDDPRSADGRLGLAKALLQEFSLRPSDTTLLLSCLTQLQAARTLAPDAATEKLLSIVWYKRAQYLLSATDTAEALSALSRATSFDPKSAAPVNLAGILCFNRGDTKKALNLFRIVTSIDSTSASGYFNTGMVFWTDSNYSAAYENWFRAARCAPDDRDIVLWAARAKARMGGAAP